MTSTVASASVARPAATTVRPPNRSASRPDTGANANMPNVCADTTRPTTPIDCPCRCIDSGAAVITAVITTWAVSIAASASRTSGRTSTVRSGPAAGTGSSGVAAGRRATSRNATTATPKQPSARAKAPVNGAQPEAPAARVDGPSSSGPPTAPTVPAHTTAPRAVPRRRASNSPAAAYRASCAAAFPTPSSSIPASSTGTEPAAAPAVATAAPAVPVRAPAPRPVRRLHRAITRLNSSTPAAVPATPAVLPSPPQPVPSRSATTSVAAVPASTIAALTDAAPRNSAPIVRRRPGGVSG
ncbi:hypothetical protein GCM10009635_58420 [Actinocatenispora thailandica]